MRLVIPCNLMQLRKEEKSAVMEKIRSHMPHGSHMETSSTRGEKQKSPMTKQLMPVSSLRLPRPPPSSLSSRLLPSMHSCFCNGGAQFPRAANFKIFVPVCLTFDSSELPCLSSLPLPPSEGHRMSDDIPMQLGTANEPGSTAGSV